MNKMRLPAKPFRWSNTTPLKWTLALWMMTGCGTASADPQHDAEINKPAVEVKAPEILNNKQQVKTLDNKNAPFGIPKISDKAEKQKVMIDAPFIRQNPELPRGCEVTSLAMLLNHAGVKVDKMTLANKVKKVPFEKSGLRGNLNDGFVGNMQTMSKPGIGVYHAPIKDLAESYLPGKVIDFTGKDFDEVITHLDQNRPVWVIVTSTYDVVPEAKWETWQTSSGPLKITYKMHSVLVTGYDQNSVYINDPLTSKNRKLPRKKFISGWEQIGKQAITIKI
ncbi:C39 family peptidase [Mesobacillus maritimus]|uniref:C39 family peptidase n=1 Tax=Mesobacillus maritimus TaxID=1643336 RepID=UPI00204268E0|nr:C39 family peptidase [Mesobacillus maritimus]MCM3585589.1 C39 family peptidase [Mesobacillus maritimus]